MNIVINIQGDKQTVARLSAFDMAKKAESMAVVKKTATAVRAEARQLVPVSPPNRKKSSGKPGDLKSSIQAKYYFNGLGAMVLPAKPKGSHRGIIEAGTKVRFNKKGQNRGQIAPHPFMAPAKASHEAEYNAEMARIFNSNTVI